MSEFVIPWCENHPAYESGTMADIGMIRLELRQTWRRVNDERRIHKWCVYMCIRTFERYGVEGDLKRGVCVARFPGKLSLKEVQEYTRQYLSEFFLYFLADLKGEVTE